MQEEVRLVSDTTAYEGANISHSVLDDRFKGAQHEITNITGLQDKLNELEDLKNLTTKNRGIAQYYAWAGNAPSEDMTGRFVSLADGTDTIKLCNGKKEDVFGVVVPDTIGVIGGPENVMTGQPITGSSPEYGLVCNSGKVKVVSESGIEVGDYVVPNIVGMAKKTVISDPIVKTHYEIIRIENDMPNYSLEYEPLETPTVYIINDDDHLGDMVTVGDAASGKTITMNKAQITVQIGDGGYANENKLCFLYKYEADVAPGYKVVQTLEDKGIKYVLIDLDSSNSSLVRLQDKFNDLNRMVAAVEQNVVTAINMANIAYDKVNGEGDTEGSGGVNKETLDVVVNTQLTAENAMDLSEKTEKDLIDTNVLLENTKAFAEEVDADLKEARGILDETKETADKATEEIEDLWAEDGALSESVQKLVGDVNEYAIGDTSQARGLTLSQANKIVKSRVIYVPLVETTETYASDSGSVNQKFVPGNSYRWNGNGWDATVSNVMFSSVYENGSSGKYWYTGNNDVVKTDDVHGNKKYQKETLYAWIENKWTEVASKDSIARVVSRTKQAANEVSTEIVSARGQYAYLGARINNDETLIEQVAKHSNGNADAIALTQNRVTNTEASITQLTEFSTKATTSEMIDGTPPGGTYYVTEPKWVAKNAERTEYGWEFSGDYKANAGVDNGFDYCYTANSSKPTTYYQYECYSENKWLRKTISVSTSMAGVIQKSDANGAQVSMLASWKSGVESDVSSIAAIKNKADKNEASINTLTKWTQDPNGKEYNLASIQQTANSAGASITQVVEAVGADGKVNAASIATAVNGSGSEVAINANKIKITGETFFVDGNGNKTTINGSNITTGSITADQIKAGSIKADRLEAGSIKASVVEVVDTLSVEGKIIAQGGTIGGFTIGQALYTNSKESSAHISSGGNIPGVYIGKDGITIHGSHETGNNVIQLKADNATLTATNVNIGGIINATSGTFSNVTFSTGTIGGIQVIPQAICNNSVGLTVANWGISSSSAYKGYGKISVGDSGAVELKDTDMSDIYLFAGASGLKDTASDNTSKTSFYVTQSGLLKTNNILCCNTGSDDNGVIALRSKYYDMALNGGRFTILDKGSSTARTGDEVTFGIRGITWKATSTTTGEIAADNANGNLTIKTRNKLKLDAPYVMVGNSTAQTGYVSIGTGQYLQFINGLLVKVTSKAPGKDDFITVVDT